MAQDILISLLVAIENGKDLSSYELALKIKNDVIDPLITEQVFDLIRDYEERLKECGK